MENFTLYNPTKVFFGKGSVQHLGKSVLMYGKRVLLMYGKGSIKTNGIYNEVISQLNGINADIVEYTGIKSNPIIEDVDAAAELGKKHQADVIVAVGGGSVIDSAKITSITIPVTHSGWDFMIQKAKPQKAVPIITVLTLAATGTEMNPFAVVQNNRTKQKPGYGHPLLYPKVSILDASYTISVSREYTAYGIVDLIAHALEAYFGEGDASLSDRFVYAVIQEAIEYGPALINNLTDYNLRAKIMYAATQALNGTLLYGKKSGDWGVHSIGHVLSVLYDVPHGASLSIAYPAWMKLHKNKAEAKIKNLGKALWNTSTVDECINAFERFFTQLNSPISLKQLPTQNWKEEEILTNMIENKVSGSCYKLDEKEFLFLLKEMSN